jgi:alanine racemase
MNILHTRPTWAEVSLSALKHNFRAIQSHVGPDVTVCAVVKADAYGHGAIECARALEADGAKWFGVTTTEEGVRLRQAGIAGRILLMTGFWRGEEEAVVEHRLTPAVWQEESLALLEAAAAKLGVDKFAVHLKLDTGMSRLGVTPEHLLAFLPCLRNAPHLAVEGAFTHLASAEVIDASDVEVQTSRFARALDKIRRSGYSPHYTHIANSAAIAARPQMHSNFVRPGISLYGYYLPFVSSSGEPIEKKPLDVRPVLSWKTHIIGLRDVSAGQGVGYNARLTTSRPTRLAVLPLGYADGLNRHLSCTGRMLVRGQFALIAGNVSMDITLLDVTDIPGTQIGDEVTIIGTDGANTITAWEHATTSHTIPYEILCGINIRVPRRYVE